MQEFMHFLRIRRDGKGRHSYNFTIMNISEEKKLTPLAKNMLAVVRM
jgi:hypothetical protein